eukprot:jgi/Botrbrau1/6055/Bobra.0042s0035.1
MDTGDQDMRTDRYVIVVGAGVAGLQVGRALQKQNIPFLILEETAEVGGVWRSNYYGYSTQIQSVGYEFPEFPYPKDMRMPWWKFPTGREVKEYVERYTDHFGLRSSIRFCTKLLHAQPTSGPGGPGQEEAGAGWLLEVQVGGEGGKIETLECSFLIIATGMFNLPAIPKHYKGLEAFKGDIVVARQFMQPSQFEGKSVLVLGGNKSAYGISENVAPSARRTALVFRRAHWVIPYWTLGVLPIFALFGRLCAWFQPPFYTVRGFQATLHRWLRPLKRCYEAFLELSMRLTNGVSGDLLPTVPLFKDTYCPAGFASGQGFYRAVRAGQIEPVLGDVDRFLANGVQLRDGRRLEGFEVAVLATGYHCSYEWLPPHIQHRLQVQEDGLYLYRHMIPPLVPGLAFISCEVYTFNSSATSGLQAEWIARAVAGTMKLPRTEEQQQDVEALKQWKRQTYPPGHKRASTLALHELHYHDQLMRDMGYSHYVHGWNLLAEALVPYISCMYRHVFQAPAVQNGRKNGKLVQPKPHEIARPSSTSWTSEKVDIAYGGIPMDVLVKQGLLRAAIHDEVAHSQPPKACRPGSDPVGALASVAPQPEE